MKRYYQTPWITRMWYPSLIWHIPSVNKIYLTFDDGPNPQVTPWILSELEKYDAEVTFFCVGDKLKKHPELSRQIIAKKHRIGNHTYNHLKGWNTEDAEYIRDIDRCQDEISIVSDGPKMFRPPYGRIKKSQIRRLKNYKIVMWSHLSWDFDQCLDMKKSIRLLKKAKPGSILVFHDSLKAFSNLKIVLPEILEHFHSQGIRFGTIK